MDQVIFLQQAGNNRQEDVCRSLQLFGAQILPAFKARHSQQAQRKAAELAPYIEQAMRHVQSLPVAAPPHVEAYPMLAQKLHPATNSTHRVRYAGERIVAAIAGKRE